MKTMFLFIAIALSFSNGKSQSLCDNLDFENGNLNNWKTYAGTVFDIDTLSIQSYDPSRFEIMSGGYDPMTGFAIPMVAPGGNYSCRLGNSKVGAEAEKITYTLNVNNDNALFIYKYAIVLEDPGHPTLDQPQFEVKILNENGEITDQTCGYYQVSAASDIPGFQNFGTIVYKDWTTVGIDLTPYIGQMVTICFITRDCGFGGHFGYAYIDAESSRMEINTVACANSDSIHMQAPIGFEYLWQPGGYTGSIFSVSTGEAEESYSCTLTSVTGCEVVLTTNTEIVIIDPDFEFISCNKVYFSGESLVDTSEIVSWNWDFGDGQSSVGINPQHFYTGAGPYNVQLNVTTNKGCIASIIKPVSVTQSPIAVLNPVTTCAGVMLNYGGLSKRIIEGLTTYKWDFGDGSFSDEPNPSKSFNVPGNYTISLTVFNGPDCKDVVETTIEVPNCEVELPNVVTPNSDGSNESFYIKNLEICNDAKLTVYNRWGNKVYREEEYNNAWSPKELIPGVYYYVFEYSPIYPQDTELAKTGYVTILK